MDPNDTIAIVSPGCIEDMVSYSRFYKEKGTPYIFDPGQSIPALTGEDITEMITGAAMLISNDYELEMIKKASGLEKGAILERTGAVITTLGEQGSIVAFDGKEVRIPAAKAAELHDPTGAGDAYRAGLIKGMVMKKDLVESARMGAVCASFAVEKHGTQEHRFTIEEFRKRFADTFSG